MHCVILISGVSKLAKKDMESLRLFDAQLIYAATPQAAVALDKCAGMHYQLLAAPTPNKLQYIQQRLAEALRSQDDKFADLLSNFTVWELQLWYFRYLQLIDILKKYDTVTCTVIAETKVSSLWKVLVENLKKEYPDEGHFRVVMI
jgi:hypothetical protein